MAVSETKIDGSYPDSQFLIPGYCLHRNDRNRGGGGILILSHLIFNPGELTLIESTKLLSHWQLKLV